MKENTSLHNAKLTCSFHCHKISLRQELRLIKGLDTSVDKEKSHSHIGEGKKKEKR